MTDHPHSALEKFSGQPVPFDRDRAIDLLEISALVTEFAHLIDRSKSAEVASLFTNSGWYGREGGSRSIGRDEIRQAYAKRAADNPDRLCRHLFSNLRVEFLAKDFAKGTSVLTLFAGDGRRPLPAKVSLIQDYLDTYERVDGRWFFASRQTFRLFKGDDFREVLKLGADQ